MSFQIGDSNYKITKVDKDGESGDENLPMKLLIMKNHHRERVMPSTSQSDGHGTGSKMNMTVVRDQNDGVQQLLKETHEMKKGHDKISDKTVLTHDF